MVRYQNVLTAALPLSAQTYQAANPRSYFAKQFSQEFNDGFSVLKHYGGNGPWSEGVSYGIDRDPPAGCTVDQVIMIHRHGERYPDIGPRADMLTSLEKVYDSNITEFKGGLAFLNTWTSFLSDYCLSGQESFSGPYAGLLSNRRQGTEYRERYGHLWDGESIVPIFTSDYERVIESARSFGEGFFAYNYSTNAAINIISESEAQGVNSLTPLCYTDDDTETCDNLTNVLPQFYGAAARLNSQNPGLDLNATDIYNLMRMSRSEADIILVRETLLTRLEMAAFELNVRPYSEWIGAFTLDEWVSYGYTQDLQYYYCAG
jgi:acid phosphatase